MCQMNYSTFEKANERWGRVAANYVNGLKKICKVHWYTSQSPEIISAVKVVHWLAYVQQFPSQYYKYQTFSWAFEVIPKYL